MTKILHFWKAFKRLLKSHLVYDKYFQNELLYVSKHTLNQQGQLYKSCQSRPFLSYQAQQGGYAFSSNQGLFWTHKYRRNDGCNHQSKPLFRQGSSVNSKTRWKKFGEEWDIDICQSIFLQIILVHYKRKRRDYAKIILTKWSNLTSPIRGKWTSVPPEGQITYITDIVFSKGCINLNQNMRKHQRNLN